MLMIFCVVMLTMLEGARRCKHDVLALEYQYKLFALRDELREHVAANPKLTKSWVFLYLDSTITKQIAILPQLSIWKMLSLVMAYHNSWRIRRLRVQLEREYRKAGNAKFEEIELKLMTTLGQYIEKKHASILASVNFLIFKALTNLLVVVNKLRKESLVVTVESPETSTLCEHCPA